jgi:hypothetical protein
LIELFKKAWDEKWLVEIIFVDEKRDDEVCFADGIVFRRE